MYKLKTIGKVKRKKNAPKKKVSRSKRTYKLVRKKDAPKKSASLHKDTKSHNVNIKVMSGINSSIISEYDRNNKRLRETEEQVIRYQKLLKNPGTPIYLKDVTKSAIKTYKLLIKEYKLHAKELKKLM
jgi:hypothetical protein